MAPESADGAPADEPSHETDARRWVGRFALLAVLVGGIAWGASASYEASRQELFSALAVFFAIGLSVVVAGVLAVAAAVAGVRNLTGPARWLGSAAVLVVGATVLGAVGGPIVGYRYRPSVEEMGTVDLALAGLGTDYVPHPSATGDCSTLENSNAIGIVEAADLGTLMGHRVTASLDFGGAAGVGDLTIDIGGEAFPQGVTTPTWEGQVPIAADSKDLAGSTRFQLGPGAGPYKPGLPAPTAAVVQGGWPDTLVGTLTWHCTGQPIQSQPPIGGTLSMVGPGLVWTAPADSSSTTCSADGISGPIGMLQGYKFSASLDFRNGMLMVEMDMLPGKEPPPGLRFYPSWDGQANLLMPGGDWHSGTATFTNLPTGVDPSVGPAPTGWPTTLTGTMTWSCGG